MSQIYFLLRVRVFVFLLTKDLNYVCVICIGYISVTFKKEITCLFSGFC